jgi:Protein of unknown function (DUF4229)
VKDFAIYTGLRIALFAACFGVAVGISALVSDHGVNLLWPFVAAVVASGVGSYFLLKAPREKFAAQVEARAARATAKFEEMRSKEDAD